MKYFDVHAHLNEEIFDKDRKKILDDCKKKDIGIINCSGTPESNRSALKMAKKYKEIKLCLGIYPVQCSEMKDKEFFDELKFIKKNEKKLVGIGEVGLDFYWIKEDKKRRLQAERFKEIVWLANKLKLPLNVHTRGAEFETVNILIKTAHVPVLLHSFTGPYDVLEAGIKNRFYFSIAPNVLYNKKKQKMIEKIPLGKLVSETDCPYLGPEPGKRNDPRNIPLVVKKIAEIKKISVEETRNMLAENAKTLFSRI